MTEAEWLACTDLDAMLTWLRSLGGPDRRTLGLLFKSVCDLVPQTSAEEERRSFVFNNDGYEDSEIALTEADLHLLSAIREAVRVIKTSGGNLRHSAAIAHDIFANPFRPVSFDPRWRTSDTTALARAIYDDRAFERLPILSDALMDAGCEDSQILEHCRCEGPHARGCWVLDLVLGKE